MRRPMIGVPRLARLLALVLVMSALQWLPAAPAQAAVPANNSFEGGTNGTTISTANSGGSSGTAFDSVTIGAAATLAFDNTRAAHGVLSAKVATGGAAAQSMVQWTTAVGTQTEVWGRVYVYFTALPNPAVKLLRFFNGASQVGAININTSGFLVLLDATNSQVAVGTVAVTTGAWARVEFHVLANATTGVIEAKLFNTADGTTASQLVSATNQNTNSALTDYRFGQTTAVANVGPFWIDDLQINNTGWPGPAGGSLSVSAPATASVTATLNGADQTQTYTLSLTAADTTGTGAGWNLTITSTTFTTGAPVHTLSTSASSVTGVTFSCPGGGCTNPTNTVTYPVAVPAGPGPPAAAKFFNAAVGTGLGTFTVTPTIQVSIPANAFAGAYTSTVTVAIVSGP